MFVSVRIRRSFVAVCSVVTLGSAGCAGTLSSDETNAELERLRAAVRQSEERVVAMQAQQAELSQQLKLLAAFLGAMANDAAAHQHEMARKKQDFTGNAAASAAMPVEPTKPPESPELEF